jgi:hypothetical protein
MAGLHTYLDAGKEKTIMMKIPHSILHLRLLVLLMTFSLRNS